MLSLGLGLRPENAGLGLGLETSGLGLGLEASGLGLVPPGLVNITVEH